MGIPRIRGPLKTTASFQSVQCKPPLFPYGWFKISDGPQVVGCNGNQVLGRSPIRVLKPHTLTLWNETHPCPREWIPTQILSCYVKYTQASFSIVPELKSLNLKFFTSLIIRSDRLSHKARTNESFNDPQALDYLSKCKEMAPSKRRNSGKVFKDTVDWSDEKHA